MNDTKKPLESKTIISGIITTVNWLVMLLVATWVIDEAIWTKIVSQLPWMLEALLVLFWLVSTWWWIWAIYGRLKANTSISL